MLIITKVFYSKLAYTKLNGKFVALFIKLKKNDMKLPLKRACANKHN